MPFNECFYLNYGTGGYILGIFVILIIIGLVFLIFHKNQDLTLIKQKNVNETSPENILKVRLAKGEITLKEYKKLLDKIK
ncbi:MAG: hypothetical protein FXF47_08995 [Candidatus Mcinerneyibacterium aminivorans]|jgi:uncharacterized membrane protein|uniref:SHOCT domain-containing protein n=1 Tax=Candidatus Mcinerneyibacterium aminivorans TaxID=2703815 RepID=A0A5D0MFX2_9BACT|nr:MAG: hypothetical protein FXF47_08995 [Candidatus Mcinerneyibacterium aminivorans]